MDLNNTQKWSIAVVAGIVFFLANLPFSYMVTNMLLLELGGMDVYCWNGGPTITAIAFHAFICIFIVRLILA